MQSCGEEASIENLKNNLNSAVNGFQTITMNDNINDVIVKTNEGYLFDVYFDEVFSEYFVEYMGQADPSYIPEVNITYTEGTGEIKVTASGNINRITITNNEKEVAGGSNTTLSYTATNSGIYKIAVETKEGLTRYGYVNVGLKKEKLKAPEIKVAAGTEGNNGWYKTDVNVEIDPTNTNGQTMHYRLTGATTKADTEITNVSGTTVEQVNAAGLTKVIAWVELEENGKTYCSDYSYFNVKIDNVNPDAPTAKITATEGNEITGESQTSTYWYKTNVELEITANDDNSGVYGYTYSITGTKSVSETALIGKTQKITFETDGTYTLIIRAIDKAGNQSTPYTITVYKDSTPPNAFTPNISNITNTGFTISAYTMDDTSGIAKYEYYVNNDKKYEGTENTYTLSGLSKDTTYGVYVNAIDKAGNIQASSAISVYTAGSTSGGTTPGGNTGPDGSTIGYGTYTIDYNANGIEVTGLPASRKFAHGETVTLTNETPRSTQPGYNFYAWSTDPVAQETLYYPGSKITGYGNITLYAIWTDKCTITFNSNGGGVEIASQAFSEGKSIVLPSNAGEYAANPTATLLGWAYTADNNFVFYTPGDVYNDYNYGSTTLYAVWDLGITVNIDTKGGKYENTHDDKVPLKFTFASGLGVNLPTDAGIHPNANITHWKWALGSETSNEYYEPGKYFSNTNANGQTLYAMWDNQINFNVNGGTGTNGTVYLKYKESITLPSPGVIANAQYRACRGWATTSSATSAQYAGNCPYLGSGVTTTLYAVWAPALKVGDYVAYTPAGNEDSYSTTQDGAERSGSGKQTISASNLTWRVFSVSSSKILLISTTTPIGNLTLRGQNGYNNGVKLLNDACNSLYKNTTLGATARNLNIEDVNGKTGYSYTIPATDYIPGNRYYPAIFQYERWGSIIGSYTGSLGQSEQDQWYSGGGQANQLMGRTTYYNYNIVNTTSDTTLRQLLCYQNETTTALAQYWLASRCVGYSSGGYGTYLMFELSRVQGTTLNSVTMYYSLQNDWYHDGFESLAMRPVVEFTPSNVDIGASGSGTSGSQYSISKK